MEDDRGRLQVLKLITEVTGDAQALAAVLEHVRTQVPAHPGLLPVTEVGVSEEGVYLASPVLNAPSVEGRLRGGRQTLEATLPWLRAVVAGLQVAHEAGVWHGAIHPRDVLVTDDGGVLTGVGVAPALEHLSMQAPVRVPYTAPERASGRAWDARADQYSLAMLALDALSGRRLIAGTIPAFDRWSLAETPAEDARLHEVFVRALHPDPDQRYASLDEWLAALGGPEGAGDEGALSRFAREGVILAAPAAADGREIELQPLEDPEGVALSLFPEEDAATEVPGGEPGPATTLAAAAAPAPDEAEAEQEWLVADVPADVVPVEPEPEPYAFTPSPTEHPHIDAPSVTAAPQADWRLDDEDASPPAVEPPRTWDVPADETSGRRPWLLAVVVLVLAALAYGTWRSLHTPATPAGSAVVQPSTEEGVPASDAPAVAEPDRQAGTPAQETPDTPSARQEPPRPVVPQAPVPPARDVRPAAAAPPVVPPASPAGPARAVHEAPATAGTGRALIRSSPSGVVTVNGRPRGETPVVLRDLPFGSYTVTITRPGFETVERDVTLLASQPVASLSVDLVRAGTTGSPAPSATPAPPDAAPASPSAGVPPGPAAGTPAAPVPSTRAPLPSSGMGRPDTRTGGIFVVSVPVSARLFVDGQLYGTTPASVPGLSPGRHTVRLEAPGHRTWEGQVQVEPGARVRVQATLQQEQE